MVKVTLKGGAVKEYDDNVTVAEIAKSLGGGLYKAACAGKLNGPGGGPSNPDHRGQRGRAADL